VHYAGPDFCGDANATRAAEETLSIVGRRAAYIERLLPRVYPAWETVADPGDVLDFWFALAHAPPLQRALAVYESLPPTWVGGDHDEDDGDDVREDPPAARSLVIAVTGTADVPADLAAAVIRAIELARPLSLAQGEQRVEVGRPLVEFVAGLPLDRAQALLAVMYLGRGDHSTFAATLNAVSRSPDSPAIIAQRMAAKVPLVTYLEKGLAKLESDRRSP
jgi:hypothetical protein